MPCIACQYWRSRHIIRWLWRRVSGAATSHQQKHATVTLLAHVDIDRSAAVFTKIGLVMSRGERMDYAIQKSTELGVTAIQLLSSHHGEVNLKPAQVEKNWYIGSKLPLPPVNNAVLTVHRLLLRLCP